MEHVRPSVEQSRSQVSADVADFLRRGGAIEHIPVGPYPAPRRVSAAVQQPSWRQYRQDEVVKDTANWRPIVGHSRYLINRRGQVWSLSSRRLLPITGQSRKVRLSTGNKNDFVRLCVDDLVAATFK